jgi:CubicO group peptidase (beta-lactamase class C family)
MRTKRNRKSALVGMLALAIAGCSGAATPGDEGIAGNDDVTLGEIGTARQEVIVGTLVSPTPVYTGIWSAGAAATEALRFNRTAAQLTADQNALTASGFRLWSLTSNVVNGAVRYSGVWNPGLHVQTLRTGLTPAAFNAEYLALFALGYRVASLTTYNVGGQLLVSAVFNLIPVGEAIAIGRTQAQLAADMVGQALLGNQIVSMTATVVGTQTLFSGIFRPIPVITQVRANQTYSAFQTERTNMAALGHRLTSLAITSVDGVAQYHSVFAPSLFVDQVNFPANEVDFGNQNNGNRSAGFRLLQIVPNVEALNITQMADRIRNVINPAAVGFSTTLAFGATRERRVGGLRRTASDAPSRAWTTSSRINMASVSKPMTAIGVMKLLATKNVSVDASISPYLPSDWVRGPNISTITFRELLTHRSGIRHPTWETYANMRTTIANGVSIANKSTQCDNVTPGFCYQNANFSIFRIIMPYLNGFSEAGVTDKATATSTAYINYMNQNVFTPSGMATASMTPTSFEPSLIYPFPAGTTLGDSLGDWFTVGAGGGWQLSTDDLVNVLLALRQGTLISASSMQTMFNGSLGWQGTLDPARHGSFAWHAGGFPPQPNGGALASMIQTFHSGVQVATVINSPTTVDIYQTVRDAYNASWMTVY